MENNQKEVYYIPPAKNCSRCNEVVDGDTGYCMKANRYADYSATDTECPYFNQWVPTCSG